MTYFFITGEESGSNYAANVIHHLKKLDAASKFYGLGGESMQHEGCELIIPLEQLSFMGFSAVLKNIFTIRKNFKETQKSILKLQPDVVCLVDYAGFNLRMAKWCKQNGFKTIYYILPKVWAWNESRLKKLQAYCDELISIFPFEVDYFKQKNISIHYFGNPLAELISTNFNSESKTEIILLPGSRKQEIKALMPVFIELANLMQNEQFKIVAMQKLQKLYPKLIPKNMEFIFDTVSNVSQNAKFAVVCSGTATLEIALLNIPQVIVYKTNFINYQIAKQLIKVPFIGLPNLIAGKQIAPELIQNNCTAEQIKNFIEISSTKNIYAILEHKLATQNTSEQVAKLLMDKANA
ncbi:MAG TPA: lipid-A-disaccharide synthase [Chitinophagales bacterium]|nr:lipid-A-disaccharide synthase [Chitinophagales bacterium]HMW93307.1 lipid-A-disaccharide synthase [Chitinophagales bacterium]HMY41561.1 lipid-A-disaccharide synthase [Chitinophagales bacterium]HMZ68266.1 lipid-A-disaccharide synthase [Chitinophagales bacterium]HNB37644.1 lipid-A-disaccharide synthase [Chitinophagales bacterium]